MKKRNLLLAIPLSLSFILAPISAFGQSVPQSKITADSTKLSNSKAMSVKEEKKALAKLGYKDGKVPIQAGKVFTLKFNDGSKIAYTTEVTSTPKERLPKTTSTSAAKNGFTTLATSYKTYSVKKIYYYGHAVVTTKLFSDVRHEGRCAYIRKNYPQFKGSWARNDYQKTRTIDGTGCTNDMATSELAGQFTTFTPNNYDVYTRTYRYRMDIDPAGGSPDLRVID